MMGTKCWLFLIFCTTSTVTYSSYPQLEYWATFVLSFSNSSSRDAIIRNLEKYNHTLPAIAKFDEWMNKNWIDPELRDWPYAKGRKETRDTMKKFLYRFKAGKAYIDYLCETAIKEGIFNKKVTEKVRGLFWYFQRWHSFDLTQSELFNPKSYRAKLHVDPAGLLKLKEISKKYLEDEKQKNILKWDYNDDY
ncbi:RxLR effector protein [Caenorhabditis elegans]|uniref:RxLR effector protein n=1 Tax=Caenorhabditis elegans TaxID=6239 RepID=B1GRN3_CAEEL|nr:RxLR effector protein [Caenorhabditis elegans]CAQ16145.2 RxLR effector protein [Caenorhabditis elegans]|eukprot:NP_001122961.2 Uncharacterized protein CELE_F57E7.4 [Caenorhabditis elegans]